MQITPLLIQMRYKGYPLYHTAKTGWGFLKLQQDFSNEHGCLLDESFNNNNHCYSPVSVDGEYTTAKLQESDFELLRLPPGSVSFYKLPHSSGNKGQNVGTPFSQDNISLVEQGLLTSDRHQKVLKSLIQTERVTRFWVSNKDRICNEQLQIIPKTAPSQSTEPTNAGKLIVDGGIKNSCSGWILPKMCVHGTLTRRATENTWLVATNAQTQAIGTELKCMVQVPRGFKFVGADVDSEELWIAALIGDSSCEVKGHGVTPLGWMVVAGDKKHATDMHSFTAGKLNLDRESAKVVNYGRIYGAGYAFLNQYLSLHANCDAKKAAKRARMLLADTKGIEKKVLTEDASFLLREFVILLGSMNNSSSKVKIAELLGKIFDMQFLDNIVLDNALESDEFKSARATLMGLNISMHQRQIELDSRSFYQCSELVSTLARLCGFDWSNAYIKQCLVARRRFHGGTESAMFSKLEEIACMEEPRTPFLNSLITKALQPKNCGSAELTSRVNWVVQSSAVDFLHLFMVAVDWLKHKYSVKMMFTLSIHDEVRYLVPDEEVTRACWVLQVAHLLTRCFFAASVGINDLPASVAYFSSIDVDTVLRKEPSFNCETFSNPLGLEKAYGIPPGLSVTPEKLAEMLENSTSVKCGQLR